MNQYDILIRPISTEKSNAQKAAINQVSFEVHKDVNRMEVKDAVERIFNVNVQSVRVMNIRGKIKRRGKILGQQKSWKKALVKLAPNQKIDFFEGV